jgi:hypothetical protein
MSPENFWVFEEKKNTLRLPGIKKRISALSTPYYNPYTVYFIPVAKAVILFITFMAIIPNISRNLYITSTLKLIISYF